MSLKLSQLDERLRARIERQIAAEDAARRPAAVHSGAAQGAEPDGGRAGQDCGVARPAAGVGFCVTLIQCRRKCLDDHDSMRFALKPTVDEIARFLGFPNDNDPRLVWQYGQLPTKGAEGVIVRIEML